MNDTTIVKCFHTISDLFSEIELDKESRINDRYPIRFIFLSSIQLLKDIVKEFDNRTVNIIELTGLLPHEDGWITVHQIIEKISMEAVGKDCIIVPLSELVRFYDRDSFLSLFNRLSAIENTRNKKRRLYIPLVGIFERFNHEFYSYFHRKFEWAPIWQVIDTISVKNKIYIIDFNVDNLKQGDFIRNTKDWLSIWKKDDMSNLICSSKNLSLLCKNTLPDQVFDIEEVHNFRELLSKVYQINIPINYIDPDKDFWCRLFEEIRNIHINDFSQLVKQVFGIENINKIDILGLWTRFNDSFYKWLLKNYVITRDEWANSYLYYVMSEIDDLDDITLCKYLWLTIFKLKKTKLKAKYEERLMLLKEFYRLKPDFQKFFIEEELKTELDGIDNYKEKLSLLTDITEIERKLLIEMIANSKIDCESLKTKYSDLYYYLNDMVIDNLSNNTWIIEYFKEYRLSKLKDAIQPKISFLLQERNKSSEDFYKWYYSFKNVGEIIKHEKVSKTLLIDAVGIEWLPYLCYTIEKSCGLNVEKKYIARSNLPSITECNKLQDITYIQNYDKDMIHSDYKYPDTFIQQLSYIKDLLNKYLYISDNDKVAITSDHGTTALARLDTHIKTYNFSDSSHEGRCMWLENRENVEDKDILFHEIDNASSKLKKYSLIALNYTSLYNRPRREVHGGGTPEEVLIPIIIVSKKKTVKTLPYAIHPKVFHITKRNPTVSLGINPLPIRQPQLLLDNKEIGVLRYDTDQNKWHIKLDKLKSGHYKMVIRIDEWEEILNIEIKGGMQERDLI